MARRVALVLLLGVPGIALLAFGGTAFIAATGPFSTRVPALLAFLGGAVAGLAGFERLHQPLYALCFLPLPFLLAWSLHLDDTGSWLGWIVPSAILGWPVLTYRWCLRHYGRRAPAQVTE